VVIANAGGGLPRRITGAVDYSTRVLALAPTSYWQMGEAAGNFADAGSLPDPISVFNYPASQTRAVAGHSSGGDVRAAMRVSDANNNSFFGVAAVNANHALPGYSVPFSIAFWIRSQCDKGPPVRIAHTRNYTQGNAAAGWSLGILGVSSAGLGLTLAIGSGIAYVDVTLVGPRGAGNGAMDGRWHHVAFVHSGTTAINSPSDWACYFDGAPAAFVVTGSTPTVGGATGPVPLRFLNGSGASLSADLQDFAIWRNRGLTASEVASLGNPNIGKASWSLARAVDATVRGLLIPGDTIQSSTGPRPGRRVYLSTGGARTEVDPSAPLDYAVTAGQTLTVDVEQIHNAGTGPVPFVADAGGNGPAVVYEESDPPTPPPPPPIPPVTGSVTYDPAPSPVMAWGSPSPAPVVGRAYRE
jgi:hypothetical protein